MRTVRLPAPGDLAAEFLPHAAPFVLLDRILMIDGALGRFSKCIATDDPLIGRAGVLPPLLMVEAMAQGAGIVLACQSPRLLGRGIAVLAAVDHCEVRRTVRAGDVLLVEAEILRRHGNIARVRGLTSVGNHMCATAELTLALADVAAAPGEG